MVVVNPMHQMSIYSEKVSTLLDQWLFLVILHTFVPLDVVSHCACNLLIFLEGLMYVYKEEVLPTNHVFCNVFLFYKPEIVFQEYKHADDTPVTVHMYISLLKLKSRKLH